MKHLHYTQSLEPLQGAGLGYSALGMHHGLAACQIESRLLATRAKKFTESWAGVTLFPRAGPERAFYSPALRHMAWELVENCNVLHGHGFYVGPNWILGREARRQRKPLVYHVQGFLDPWILARSRWKKRLAHWLFESANFRYAKLWRAVSSKEETQIRAVGIKAPIIVLPNGVNLPTNCNADATTAAYQKYPKKRSKRAIFLSRIHPKKGLDLLIPAWARLPEETREDWELLIFGPNEGGYAAQVHQWIQELNLSPSVFLMGGVTGSDKSAAFLGADLFILPSYSEGFPMAVLEAASYKIPIIQTDECNFPCLTEAGGAWEAVPTVESVYGKLVEALSSDDSELTQRGQLGFELVSKHYTWASIAQQLDEACQTLL